MQLISLLVWCVELSHAQELSEGQQIHCLERVVLSSSHYSTHLSESCGSALNVAKCKLLVRPVSV